MFPLVICPEKVICPCKSEIFCTMFINQKTQDSLEPLSSPAIEKHVLITCAFSQQFHCSVDSGLVWEVASGLHQTPKQQLTPCLLYMMNGSVAC